MSNENGPDRSLGLWCWPPHCEPTPEKVYVRDGVVVWRDKGGTWRHATVTFPSVSGGLEAGATPLDTTAKREAIRAGWRCLDGEWVKDERKPRCWHHDPKCGPGCWEGQAKRLGEWPADEPAPAPEPGSDVPESVVSRDAERALAAVWNEAFLRGQEHEHEKAAKAAKPCVLKRLSDQGYNENQGLVQVEAHELTARAILWLLLSEAGRSKVDLSDLAERMAAGVQG